MEEPVTKVITKEDRNKMTPADVLQDMKDGNERFLNGQTIGRDVPAMVEDSYSGQAPKAAILSCIDSRVPVEEVFDQGIGDIFVARVAGNIANEDLLGSIEYACLVAGSKLVVVMGHEGCGAVKSAIDDALLGNISVLLSRIRPSIGSVSKDEFPDDRRNSEDTDFVKAVCNSNVINTVKNIRIHSPILKELEDMNKKDKKTGIMIVGAVYFMSEKNDDAEGKESRAGRVEFFNV